MILVNDIHSRLNETRVAAIIEPKALVDLVKIVRATRASKKSLAVCGGRHAMGGQQFLEDGVLVDMRFLNRILEFDHDLGTVTVEAGCMWPQLIDGYSELQMRERGKVAWGIAQKQTGADALTVGGAVSANVHGRGLLMKPLVGDVIELQIVNADGDVVTCSRSENPELFRLAVGGYGLFGIISSVTLQLVPRRVLRRVVRVIDIEEAVPAAWRRIEQGFTYGDFQFDIDSASPDFLTKGVFSGYIPVDDIDLPPDQKEISSREWEELLYLAHTDKRRAFQLYAAHYLGTDGQLYHSDTHQLSTYLDDYHTALDQRLGATSRGSEMISELYVPQEYVIDFLKNAARRLVALNAPVIYGTIRLIQKDEETFLPWARNVFACVVVNLHVDHTPEGINRSVDAFQALIDEALQRKGSFFLTYHRFATKAQLLSAYPELPEFLNKKIQLDPDEIFQSDWYRWLKHRL